MRMHCEVCDCVSGAEGNNSLIIVDDDAIEIACRNSLDF